MDDLLCKVKEAIQNISKGEANIPMCFSDVGDQCPDIPIEDISKALYDLEKEGFIIKQNEISYHGITTINMFTLSNK